eukprot:TRINITY_DN2532_c0_g1_i3.p1 TRINITY_DN2532_c0_g1~~TRINITY_DN2532_c0_g1_i3.p1  ORF type:complete len:575 (-),score=119.86 TRINITY_DN2532_c0_g1_i3:22-1746(-)
MGSLELGDDLDGEGVFDCPPDDDLDDLSLAPSLEQSLRSISPQLHAAHSHHHPHHASPIVSLPSIDSSTDLHRSLLDPTSSSSTSSSPSETSSHHDQHDHATCNNNINTYKHIEMTTLSHNNTVSFRPSLSLSTSKLPTINGTTTTTSYHDKGTAMTPTVQMSPASTPLNASIASLNNSSGGVGGGGNGGSGGLISKGKRITLVRGKQDLGTVMTWDQIVKFFKVNEQLYRTEEISRLRGVTSHCDFVALEQELMNHHAANGADAPPIWIDFQGMDHADMPQIGDFFGLHFLTLEDIMASDTREKAEHVPSHAYHFVVAAEMRYKEYSNVLETVTLSALLYHNFILTFHDKPLLSLHQVMRLLDFCPDQRIPSSDWVLYALLDGIIDLYENLVSQTALEAESLDELVIVLPSSQHEEMLSRISAACRKSAKLYSSLWNKKEILTSLNRDTAPISRSTRIYMLNVQDHVLRMDQKLKLARNLLSELNSTYMAKISIELSEASNRVNIIMRKFAVISSIFLPLTLISGIFGMNVRIPGMIGFDDTPPGYEAFIALMAIMVGLAILMMIVFKIAKWL